MALHELQTVAMSSVCKRRLCRNLEEEAPGHIQIRAAIKDCRIVAGRPQCQLSCSSPFGTMSVQDVYHLCYLTVLTDDQDSVGRI